MVSQQAVGATRHFGVYDARGGLAASVQRIWSASPVDRGRAVGRVVTKIVIAGGGFAGLYAAMYFDRTLARRGEADVTLISRENFTLFTPMLHEVAAGDLQPSDIVSPLRRVLRHVQIVEAEVDAI